MHELAKITDISLTDESSWRGKTFVTFDLDWCSDEVLIDTLNLLDKYNCKATFFCTHRTPVVDAIIKDNRFDVGIHPNFNPLLELDPCYGRTVGEVVKYYTEIIPEAVASRSHSLTMNSKILYEMCLAGIKYECSKFIPHESSMELRPWGVYNGKMLETPFNWEDDVYFSHGQFDSFILKSKGYTMVDFHPIHIFLNTDSPTRYSQAKPYLKKHKELGNYVNKGLGTRNILIDILERSG